MATLFFCFLLFGSGWGTVSPYFQCSARRVAFVGLLSPSNKLTKVWQLFQTGQGRRSQGLIHSPGVICNRDEVWTGADFHGKSLSLCLSQSAKCLSRALLWDGPSVHQIPLCLLTLSIGEETGEVCVDKRGIKRIWMLYTLGMFYLFTLLAPAPSQPRSRSLKQYILVRILKKEQNSIFPAILCLRET